MKPSEILRAGLNLLETKGWTQKDYAKDANGDAAFSADKAVCFCSIGAMRVVSFGALHAHNHGDYHTTPYLDARKFLHDTLGINVYDVESFANWQDEPNRTFAEVKAKFLEAVALAEEQEKGVTL